MKNILKMSLDASFAKADSRNLPVVSAEMMAMFWSGADFSCPEIRGVKAKRYVFVDKGH